MTDPLLARDTAVVRAVHRFKIGDLGAAHTAAQRILELGGRDDSFAATVAHLVLGMSLFWRGDAAASIRALSEAVRLARRTDNQLAETYALGYLAAAHLHVGALAEAQRIADVAVERTLEPAVAEHFVAALPHLALAATLAVTGQVDRAGSSAARAVDLARRGGGRLEVGLALATEAQVQIATGGDGRASLEAARLAIRDCPDPGWLPERLAALRRYRRPPVSRSAGRHDVRGPVLTEREAALLPFLQGTLSLREIGSVLHVSLNTVKTHSRTLYRKLGVSSRGDAVRRARDLGWL